jgi:hypothetical protein
MKLKKSEIIEIIKEVLDEKITDTGYMMNVRDLKKTFKNYQKPEVGTMKKRGLKYTPLKPSEKSGEGIRQREKMRSAKYSQDIAGTKTAMKKKLRKDFAPTTAFDEGLAGGLAGAALAQGDVLKMAAGGYFGSKVQDYINKQLKKKDNESQ